MNAVGHIALSSAGGAALGLLSGSPEAGLAFFFGGWAIDLDHLADFVRTWGIREGLTRMARLGIGPANRPLTAYFPLHGFELSALLLALAAALPGRPWILGLAAGHLFHMVLDQATNEKRFSPAYFLVYRAIQRFDFNTIFPRLSASGAPPDDPRNTERAQDGAGFSPPDASIHRTP